MLQDVLTNEIMKMKSYFVAAALGMLALSACNGTDKSATTATAAADSVKSEATIAQSKTEIFKGMLPAADADGIEYTLTLNYTDDNCGTYNLVQVYQNKDKSSFTDDGSFVIDKKDDKSYLKLTDSKNNSSVQYYLIDSPSKITLVGADMKPAATGLNYSLTLQ